MIYKFKIHFLFFSYTIKNFDTQFKNKFNKFDIVNYVF